MDRNIIRRNREYLHTIKCWLTPQGHAGDAFAGRLVPAGDQAYVDSIGLMFLYPEWPAPASVRALVTTRAGGVSGGAYRSLNLGEHVGDDPEHVRRNRARLRARLPADPVWLAQTHGTDVVDAARTHAGASADGAYTRARKTVCAVLTADCLPVFVCNRQGTEVALLHAGWRGRAAGILERGLAALQSPAAELLVWLGPAISAKAYEVGDEVREVFVSRDIEASAAFVPGRPGKWCLDLYGLARHRLRRQGVRAIYGGNYCTAMQPELFFSHRRDGATGRMASLIWLE